jgi:DNA-binding CsgD family transcriptional regulator
MRQVLQCGARGLGVEATGRELGIAAGTVRNVRLALVARLDVQNFAAAIAAGFRRGELT